MTIYTRVLWRIVRPVLWLAANYAGLMFLGGWCAFHMDHEGIRGAEAFLGFILFAVLVVGLTAAGIEERDPVLGCYPVTPLGMVARRLSKIAQEEREAMREDRAGLLRPVEDEPRHDR